MKWLNRWYLNLFIIPFGISIVSGVFTWQVINTNLLFSFVIALTLYALIISIEFFRYYKKQSEVVSEYDKTIILELINILNLDHVYESFYLQNGWYGYEEKHIKGFLYFTEDSQKLVNRIHNKDIQELIDNAVTAINDFNKIGVRNLFLVGSNYVLNDIGIIGYKEKELIAEQLNKLASIAYDKIVLLPPPKSPVILDM